MPIKIVNFKNQDGGREKRKKCNISESSKPNLMKFVLLMHIDLIDTTEQKHLNFENATWLTTFILKNRRGAIYLQSRLLTNFAEIWHDDASRPSGPISQ